MANTPEAEVQEEQLEEQQLEEEIEVFVPHKHAKRGHCTKPKLSTEELWEDDNLPSIHLIHTKEYLNVNRITNHDHLMDENWHKWKERMR